VNTRTTLLIWSALALVWGAGAALYVYPDVQEEIEEKRYLDAVEKQHLHVLSIDCARARGIENRDLIGEDTDPTQCWLTIPGFNALYPEIAGATDIGATLRSQERASAGSLGRHADRGGRTRRRTGDRAADSWLVVPSVLSNPKHPPKSRLEPARSAPGARAPYVEC
jgi:hypothetical protein